MKTAIILPFARKVSSQLYKGFRFRYWHNNQVKLITLFGETSDEARVALPSGSVVLSFVSL